MRAVLDTNVLVRAAANESGLAGSLLKKITAGEHVLVLSPYILGEVSRVLAYPRLRARWLLDTSRIREFVEGLAGIAEIVRASTPAEPVVAADPNDDPIIQTAILGCAEVLVTRDSHLLAPAVLRYCAAHGIRVMDDVELHGILS